MNYKSDRNRIFKLFLVIYFLTYSISPLTYTLSSKQVSNRVYSTNNESSGAKSVHIFLWDLFIKRLSTWETHLHNAGNASILIKPKRAIASENISEKLSVFKNPSAPKGSCNQLVPKTFGTTVLTANILGIYTGFNPIYAGNSPPSV
jgi:hypothetical protein